MRSVRLRIALVLGAAAASIVTLSACDGPSYASAAAADHPPAADGPSCTYLAPF
jgi:hypothetical protein